MTDTKQLGYGLTRAVPETAAAAWGARLIAPSDLVQNRQDLTATSDADKAALIAWLNGTPGGSGAISQAKSWLVENYRYEMRQDWEQIVTLYEDETGIIQGSTNASFGYVYVAGWLK